MPRQDAIGESETREDSTREVAGQLYQGGCWVQGCKAGGGWVHSVGRPYPQRPHRLTPCTPPADYLPSLRTPPAFLRTRPPACLPACLLTDIEFGSPDVHYLCSITVNAGKVYAMFVKSPQRVRAESAPPPWGVR